MLDPRISTMIRLGAAACDEADKDGGVDAYREALGSFSDPGEVQRIGVDAWHQIADGIDPEALWGSTDAGQVWILTHSGSLPFFHKTNVFADRGEAIRVLAERCRPRYAGMIADIKERYSKTNYPEVVGHIPDEAPENPFELVAYYFSHPNDTPGPASTWNEKFSLHEAPMHTEFAPPTDFEYITVMPFQKWECLCGNHAADNGFTPFNPETGTYRQDPIEGFGDYHLCGVCGRVIENATGRILKQLTDLEYELAVVADEARDSEPAATVTHEDLVAALLRSCWQEGKILESTILLSPSEAATVRAWPTGDGFKYTVKVGDVHGSETPTVATAKLITRDPGEVLAVLTALRFISTP